MKNEDYLERVFYNVIKEKNIKFDGLFGLMLKGLICLVGTNLIYSILFYNKKFKYIKSIIINMLNNKFKNTRICKVS